MGGGFAEQVELCFAGGSSRFAACQTAGACVGGGGLGLREPWCAMGLLGWAGEGWVGGEEVCVCEGGRWRLWVGFAAMLKR